MRGWGVALALALAAGPAAGQEVRLAAFADADLGKPFPAFVAAAALGPTAVILAGDVDHRNPQTLATMRAMHAAVLAATAGFGVPVFSVWDDHDYCRNNATRACPTRALALQAWGELRPLCPDHGYPAGLWQRCSVEGGWVEIYLLDTRSQRDARWASRSISSSVIPRLRR